MKTLYDIDEKNYIDEFGVDHSNFSLRDEIEYNFRRAKEKELQQSLLPQGQQPMQNQQQTETQSPWYRRAYDKVYNEANKLNNEPLYDKYKHATVSCVGAQGGLYDAFMTGGMGIGKEIQDISRKIPRQWSGQQDYGGYLSILGDSAKDLVADAKGIYKGYNNPTGDCYDMMKSYYNPYKK